jgi:hypothetical protein
MITIDWTTKIIHIPQNYLSFVSAGRYSLDIEAFRNDLKNIEDTEEGMVFSNTHSRNAPVTLSGTTYSQTLEILTPYTVTFENTGIPYLVIASGANHNISDVTNYDGGMSLAIGNSAGLIAVNTSGSSYTLADIQAAVRTELTPELTKINNQVDGLTSTQATMLFEMYRILGLDPTKPLIVSNTERTAGTGITQTVTDDGTSMTVTRV